MLRHLCEEFSQDEFKYDAYAAHTDEKDYYGQQPQIASFLEKDYNLAVFSDDRFIDFKQIHRKEIQAGISPFKIALAERFKKVAYDRDNKELDLLKKLSIRSISGIITTNYDFFLESIFDGFQTFTGQDELIFANLAESGEIYKIHGSAQKPESIVITAEDYQRFEKMASYLIAKILTIFLEYPIIFLGYSLQDRNIRNILRTISECLPQSKLELLKRRFVFVDYAEGNVISEYTQSFENGKSIAMTRVATQDFMPIYEAIYEVKSKYNPRIIRELRHDVYELANETHPTERISASGFENLDKIEEGQLFILGVGVQKYSGHLVKAEQIYEDIVFDNQFFNPVLVVEEYLPELLKRNTGGLPMYKYIRYYSGELFERIKINVLKFQTLDSFLNEQLRISKRNYRQSQTNITVAGIIQSEGKEEAYKKLIYLEADEFDVAQMERYLEELMKRDQHILKNNSLLKRLIRMYDLAKYKNTPV